MGRLELYIPKVEDYWYEEKIQSDPKTMSYNAGWDVSYFGYHYDTGCIDFPKERWEEVYNKRMNEKRFFAYLKDTELNEFVGYVNYHFNNSVNRYDCGILIEDKYRGNGYSKEGLKLLCDYAKSQGIDYLYDDFEDNRPGTSIFYDLGFKEIDRYQSKRFDKYLDIVVVGIDLNEEDNNISTN